MDNSIFVIRPYKYHDTWVFDDESVGLVKEPFVCGMPEIIDKLTEHLDNPEQGFTLLFSDQPCPSMQHQFKHFEEEVVGNWYRVEGTDMEGWLCPALFKYFSEAPATIYVRIEQ